MKTSISLAISVGFISVVSAVSSMHPHDKDHRFLAEQLAIKVTEDFASEGRNLQSISPSFFRQEVCDPFEDGFTSTAPPGSYCSCATPTQYSITCYSPQPQCGSAAGCSSEICQTGKTTVTFTPTNGGRDLILSFIEYDWDYEKAVYSGSRTQVFLKDGEKYCNVFYTLDNTEYSCKSCSICNDEEISLDCSNIQEGATSSGCVTDEEADGTDLNLCQAADEPEQVSKPKEFSAGSMSVASLVVTVAAATGVVVFSL